MAKVYIDTNVFLDFYQSAKDRMAIFEDLLARANSIVIPEQTAREIRRNRAARLTVLAEQVEKSAHVNVYTTAIVRELPAFKEWEAARDAMKSHVKSIAKQLRIWATDEATDPVYQKFLSICGDGTTMATPDGALEKAKQRKLIGEPPTSPDKHTIGDELIWETLLAHCDDDLIVVSRDRTFLDNVSILKSEFNVDGKRNLIAVTDSLSDGLTLVGRPSVAVSEAEQASLCQDEDSRKAFATGRCPRCNIDMNEEGYEGNDGDEAWWLTCPRCHLLAFPAH